MIFYLDITKDTSTPEQGIGNIANTNQVQGGHISTELSMNLHIMKMEGLASHKYDYFLIYPNNQQYICLSSTAKRR